MWAPALALAMLLASSRAQCDGDGPSPARAVHGDTVITGRHRGWSLEPRLCHPGFGVRRPAEPVPPLPTPSPRNVQTELVKRCDAPPSRRKQPDPSPPPRSHPVKEGGLVGEAPRSMALRALRVAWHSTHWGSAERVKGGALPGTASPSPAPATVTAGPGPCKITGIRAGPNSLEGPPQGLPQGLPAWPGVAALVASLVMAPACASTGVAGSHGAVLPVPPRRVSLRRHSVM